MYEDRGRTLANKEKELLEKEINQLIANYEDRWKTRYTKINLIPIPGIKNSLP